MTTTHDSLLGDAHVERVPPRFWWLKRIGIGVALYVLLLVGVRLWWGYYADSRLQAEIDKYRAAGQPVTIEDFAVPALADEDNAAYYLRQASAKLVQPPGSNGDEYHDALSASNWLEVSDKVRLLVEANSESLTLVRAARARSQADWGYTLSSLLTSAFLPIFADQRALIKTTVAAALYRHRLGDDSEAVETIRDCLGIGRGVAEVAPSLIAYFVRAAADALSTSAIEAIAHELRVAGPGDTVQLDVCPATRQQVQALVEELLDEQELSDNWLRVMYGERANDLNLFQVLWRGSPPPAGLVPPSASGLFSALAGVPSIVVAPLWELDTVHELEATTAFARAGLARNWPAARQSLLPKPSVQSVLARFTTPLSSIIVPSLETSVELHFRLLADRRMAAIALAIRLYEVDHGGRPATLGELVPEYLPLVPRDPFDPDDGTIRYCPDAPRPLLYSVHLNGVDDGGAFDTSPGYVAQRSEDRPFFLNGDRPKRLSPSAPAMPATRRAASQPASTQAVPDDGSADHRERQREK